MPPRPLGQAASDMPPTQAELDAAFQAQLDREFLAQRAPKLMAPVTGPQAIEIDPQGQMQLADPQTEQARLAMQAQIGTMAGQSLLPTAGAAAGMAVPFPASLMAAPVGAALGEVANRALGITQGGLEETLEQAGLTGAAAAIPLAPSGVRGAAAKAARASRPGRLVAQELAVEEAQRLPQLRVPVASAADELFALARQTNPRISVEPFREALTEFRARQAITAKKGQQRGPLQLAQQIEGFAVGEEIDLQTLFENTKAAGRLLRQARQSVSPEAEGYAVIYRAGRETLEEAAAAAKKKALPGTPMAVNALDAALHAFRREAIRDDLAEIIADKVLSKPRQGDLRVEVRMGALLDALTSDKSQYTQFQRDLRKALTPAEIQALVADVKVLGQVKPLPAVAGAEKGAGRGLSRALGGAAVGEIAGQAIGAHPGVGAVVGGAFGERAAEIVAESLINGRARPLLIRMLKTNPSLSGQSLSLLAAAAMAQRAERRGGPRMESP